ncbi:MAG: amino acid adenylation domain-containing protein [Actinomycetota bacterium]
MMSTTLHGLLERAARGHPNQTAVVDGNRSISYSELDGRSNQVARLLIQSGVQRGDRVGLYLTKSLESIIGIYGVMKAGGAYVPLDAQAPVSRVGFICGNCGVNCLLSGGEMSDRWADLVSAGAPLHTVIALNTTLEENYVDETVTQLSESDLDGQATTSPGTKTISLDLAYILYTSGSTGEPKGVMLTHSNALSFVNWAAAEFGITQGDNLANHAPLHFDLSILDLFAAAREAATVVLVPPETSYFPIEITRFIDKNRITIWYSVPSVLTMLALRGGLKPGALESLRVVLFAGEVFPVKYLRMLMTALPSVRFVNLYGPTETNVCTFYDVDEIPDASAPPVPIGQAIADDEVFSVTEGGRIAEQGEMGELYVRGTTVMQGYWGDAERTQQCLIAHPFGGELHDPVYKTGDLVRCNDNGDYELLGRRDHQIKSRGYRIELGDIEAALYAHPDVVECVAMAVPDELVTNRIKAVVAVRVDVTREVLVQFCSERIPHYMIPEWFEFRNGLPKTSTGKIDRQTLTAELVKGGSR